MSDDVLLNNRNLLEVAFSNKPLNNVQILNVIQNIKLRLFQSNSFQPSKTRKQSEQIKT